VTARVHTGVTAGAATSADQGLRANRLGVNSSSTEVPLSVDVETGFIRSVDDAVHRFHDTVVARLGRQPPPRTSPSEAESVAQAS